MFEKYLSAFFTRKQGFEIISTNLGLSKNETIDLLLQHIPQGKTPPKTQILSYWQENIVITYLETVSETDFFVLLLLFKPKNELSFIEQSIFDEENQKYAQLMGRRQISFEELKKQWKKTEKKPLPALDENSWAHILFSILAGDNIIITSKNMKQKEAFFEFITHEIPILYLKYNRFILHANELRGNGNIVGLDKIPDEKHIMEEFGIDTIIVDLDTASVTGEGLKISPIVKEMAREITDSPELFKELISSITEKWNAYNWDLEKEENAQDRFLLQKIKKKLFGDNQEEETDFFSEF